MKVNREGKEEDKITLGISIKVTIIYYHFTKIHIQYI